VEEHISIGNLQPGTPAFQNAFVAWMKTVQNVLVMDDGLTMSQNNPFGRRDARTLFENDLNNWGRYKLVSSLADADFVIDVSATGYCDRDSCTDSLDMTIEDPRTLRVLAFIPSFTPNVYAKKKNQPDPFPSSMQDFVNEIRGIVGDPLP
jgi:hypothetical protein